MGLDIKNRCFVVAMHVFRKSTKMGSITNNRLLWKRMCFLKRKENKLIVKPCVACKSEMKILIFLPLSKEVELRCRNNHTSHFDIYIRFLNVFPNTNVGTSLDIVNEYI